MDYSNLNIPNNSGTQAPETKEEEKKVEKIVSGKVKTRKKSVARKFADVFIAGDLADIKDYAIRDVLIPRIKDSVLDVVTNGLDMLLNNEPRGRNTSTVYRSTNSRTSYSSYYNNNRNNQNSSKDNNSRSVSRGYNFDDIVLETRGEAEEVLSQLLELIDVYGSASVADLYSSVGTSGNYTDNKYGWTNLASASTRRVRDGYMLVLPKAVWLE